MSLLEIILGCLAVSMGLAWRLSNKRIGPLKQELSKEERAHQEMRVAYLAVLRREAANLIVNANPDLMIELYDKVMAYESRVEADEAFKESERSRLANKHLHLTDFDLLELRHFIPYEHPDYDIERTKEWYLDASHQLCLEANASFYKRRVTSEKEREILQEQMQQAKDRGFKARVEAAMREYWISAKEGTGIDNDTYRVFRIHIKNTGSNWYAVEMKEEREFALCEIFVFDDGIRTSTSVHRTNKDFDLDSALRIRA